MNPGIARTLADQRREELTHDRAGSGGHCSRPSGQPGWLSRHRWHVTWSRTILSPAGGLGTATGGYPDRPARRGSSLVIIISAHR